MRIKRRFGSHFFCLFILMLLFKWQICFVISAIFDKITPSPEFLILLSLVLKFFPSLRVEGKYIVSLYAFGIAQRQFFSAIRHAVSQGSASVPKRGKAANPFSLGRRLGWGVKLSTPVWDTSLCSVWRNLSCHSELVSESLSVRTS